MTLRVPNIILLSLIFAGAVHVGGASAAEQEFFTLPPVRVYGSWIAVNYYQGKDGRVTRVLIQEVTPNSPAARLGLRKGDELMAIDETSVVGMSDEQFVDAYARTLLPHTHRDYDFRCYRGFLGTRERILRFRITTQ
jgi:membrane-associated protease RseP (regulator of RpoE activity)